MIYDANSIDIIGKRLDGGVDLYIISSGAIDASPETQTLLLDKVENYLGYICSEEFKKDFPDVRTDMVSIVFELDEKPPRELLMLCERIVPWTKDYGVTFLVRKKSL